MVYLSKNGKVSSIFQSRSWDNPRDRSYDRALDKAGFLTDATPLFATAERVEGSGFLMVQSLKEEDDRSAFAAIAIFSPDNAVLYFNRLAKRDSSQ